MIAEGAYYNDNNPFAAATLRELILDGLIAPGDVDERSIAEVTADDIRGYTQVHLCAGLGGWSYALRLAGWPDHRPVWTASFPCQSFSLAGKGAGFEDERHIWPFGLSLIKKLKPSTLFGEQSSNAAGWINLVRGDLEALGYAVGAIPIEAACKGATHKRDRFWLLADAEWDEQPREEPCGWSAGRVGRVIEPFPWDEPWESALSRFRALGDGLPRSVGASDAARNAIVPQVAAEIISSYMEYRP